MKLIDDYKEAKKKLLDYVGYNGHLDCAIDDRLNEYWAVDDGEVFFGPDEPVGEGEFMYAEELYKDRDRKNKEIWRGEDMSMVIISLNRTQYFTFFPNDKEVKGFTNY